VKDAQVSLEQAEAVLEFDPAMTDVEHLRKAIEDGGYEAI
jgi:copper chaperone CopZ